MTHIFVLDDEPLVLNVISSMLVRLGYRVTTRSTAVGAFDEICTIQPDLILLDVVLPPCNGYQMCTQLSAEKTTAHIPILMMTGAATAVARQEAGQVGAVGILGKPFTLNELEKAVTTALQPFAQAA